MKEVNELFCKKTLCSMTTPSGLNIYGAPTVFSLQSFSNKVEKVHDLEGHTVLGERKGSA